VGPDILCQISMCSLKELQRVVRYFL